MNSHELVDDLSRILASGMPRRQALKLIVCGFASQLFPWSAPVWADDPFCPDNVACPAERSGCEKLSGTQCAQGKETLLLCLYSGNDCRDGTSKFCTRTLDERACAGDTPFCCKIDDKNATCGECKTDKHCTDKGKKGCCNCTCCTAENPYCCKGTKTTSCCRNRECCNADGTCSKSKGKILEYEATYIEVEIREPHVGVSRIAVHEIVNATVDIPAFKRGTTKPIHVVAWKIDPKQRSFLMLKVTAANGCECCDDLVDPVLAQLAIPPGRRRIEETFERIPAREHFLTLQNGKPGLRRAQIFVNEQLVAEAWLRAGTVRLFDVEEWMTEEENVVTVIADGPPESNALFMVADVPSDPAKVLTDGPPVRWEPVPWEPGQDLHWGR